MKADISRIPSTTVSQRLIKGIRLIGSEFLTSAGVTDFRMQPYYRSQHYVRFLVRVPNFRSMSPNQIRLLQFEFRKDHVKDTELTFPLPNIKIRGLRYHQLRLGLPVTEACHRLSEVHQEFNSTEAFSSNRMVLYLQFGTHYWKLLSTLYPLLFFLGQLLIASR